MTDFIETLELSVKTSNLLKKHGITENQFLYLTKTEVQRMGGLVKSWKEIEEVQPVVREIRAKRRRESTIGRATAAVRELNEIQSALSAERLFIHKDNRGRYRVGRYINREDLESV